MLMFLGLIPILHIVLVLILVLVVLQLIVHMLILCQPQLAPHWVELKLEVILQ